MFKNIYLVLFVLSFIFSCKSSVSESLESFLLLRLPIKKDYQEVVIVHPNICGSCSSELLNRLALENKNSLLISTSNFDEKDSNVVKLMKRKLIFLDQKKLQRLGLSNSYPSRLVFIDRKLVSNEQIEI